MPKGPFGGRRFTELGPFVEPTQRANVRDEARTVIADLPEEGSDFWSVTESTISIYEDLKDRELPCGDYTTYASEALVFNPEQNVIPLEVLAGEGKQLEDTVSRAAFWANDFDNGECILVHGTTDKAASEIMELGFLSRRGMGLENVEKSELRHSSAYFHANVMPYSRTVAPPKVDDSVVIAKANIDATFLGYTGAAKMLMSDVITEEEYHEHGIIDYKQALECSMDDFYEYGESDHKGSFFPFKFSDGRNNFESFEETVENILAQA